MADDPLTAAAPATADVASAAASTAFVLCIENNETRGQALLLIESLREFGGRFARCPILAVAPRSGLGVDAATRTRLEALDATYHEAPLNTVCPEYGSANRVYAAAWAARTSPAETLVVLDSDAIFLDEPEALGEGWDLAVRPVDRKGATSEGVGDPFEPYWVAFCGLADMAVEALPFVETVIDRRRVRASYNGGYAVVRRASWILERAADLFTRSVRADLRPYKGVDGHRVFASTGEVSARASEFWGSNQAALSIAAWSTTRRVRVLDRRFNVPLHCLADPEQWSDEWAELEPIHLHYHWLLRAGHRDEALAAMARIGVSAERLDWVRARATLIEKGPVPAAKRPAAASAGQGRQLIVTGMHRSATSLVANLLQQAGLEIGDELVGPGPGNRRGHFEDRDFFALHEEMLAAAGTTALSADEGIAPPVEGDFEVRARALIERRAGLPVWGFKDPRTCLFLEFWSDLLPQANFLFLYRHPVDVALSLRRRATDAELRLDPWAGIRAWELYNRRLLQFIERHPERCFLAQVPALTVDLGAFVQRLAVEFDLPLRDPGAAAVFAPAELTTEGARQASSPAWKELIPEALEVYRRLEETAGLPSCASDGKGAPAKKAVTGGLYQDLLQSRWKLPAVGAAESSDDPRRRWTVVDRRGFARVLADLHAHRRTVAELQRGVEAAVERRDELAATLAAIERSRSFALVARGWRLAAWVRRLGRKAPG